MNVVSTNTQFALGVHTLTMLAASAPDALSSELMAESAQANPVHVRRVLGRFREAGLVASRPGVGGGSQLLREPEQITLADVWRIVQGESHLFGSYAGDPNCPVGRNIQSWLADFDCRATRAVQDELATTTIAQLVDRALSGGSPH